MAQELVNLLFGECKSPGNAFRYKVREEIPNVDLFQESVVGQAGFNNNNNNNNINILNNNNNINFINNNNNINEEIKDKDLDEKKSRVSELYRAILVCDDDQAEVGYLSWFQEQLFY